MKCNQSGDQALCLLMFKDGQVQFDIMYENNWQFRFKKTFINYLYLIGYTLEHLLIYFAFIYKINVKKSVYKLSN